MDNFDINLTNLDDICINTVITRLRIAKYFKNTNAIKIILNHLQIRILNKTHPSDYDMLKYDVITYAKNTKYILQYIYDNEIITEEILLDN